MSGGERRTNRSNLDAKDLCDAPVVEVGVVPKKDDQTLPLRQPSKRGCQLAKARRLDRRDTVENSDFDQRPPGRLPRRVHHRPPHPRIQSRFVAETVSPPNRVGEAVVHSLQRPLAIAEDPPRYANERRELSPVKRLDPGKSTITLRHLPSLIHNTPFLFTRRLKTQKVPEGGTGIESGD